MSRWIVPSCGRGGLRLLCATVALAAALCAMVLSSDAPDDMSMTTAGSSASTSDQDRLAPIGCEGACAGDATTACAASVLVAMTLAPLLGRGRAGFLHVGPRGPTSATPPASGGPPVARHVAAPSLLVVLRV